MLSARESWLKTYGNLGWSANRTSDGAASWACSESLAGLVTPAMLDVGKKYVALAR